MKNNRMGKCPWINAIQQEYVETIELIRYVPKNGFQSQPEESSIHHDMLRPRSGKAGFNQEAPKPENFQM